MAVGLGGPSSPAHLAPWDAFRSRELAGFQKATLREVEDYASCLSAAPVKWWPCKEEEKEEDIGTFVSE